MKIEDWMLNQEKGNRLIVGRITRRDGQVALIEVDVPEWTVKAGLAGMLSRPIEAVAVPVAKDLELDLSESAAVTYEDTDL